MKNLDRKRRRRRLYTGHIHGQKLQIYQSTKPLLGRTHHRQSDLRRRQGYEVTIPRRLAKQIPKRRRDKMGNESRQAEHNLHRQQTTGSTTQRQSSKQTQRKSCSDHQDQTYATQNLSKTTTLRLIDINHKDAKETQDQSSTPVSALHNSKTQGNNNRPRRHNPRQ